MQHPIALSVLVLSSGCVLSQITTGLFFHDGHLHVLVVTGWALLEYFLIVSIYRLQFHPLAKYPGPWWAAITDWYTVIHLAKGDRHLDFYRLHLKHGKFVRFGPHRLSINSAEALRDIFAVRANTQKSTVYGSFKYFFNGVDMSMTEIDRDKHAFKRRVNASALNADAVRNVQEQILANTRYFCTQLTDEKPNLEDGWSAPRNISRLIGYLVSDIMGDVTFSKNWDVQRDKGRRHFVDDSALGTAGIHLTGHMPGLFFLSMHKILFWPLIQGVQQLARLSDSITEWRVAQGANLKGKDLFSALLEAVDPVTGKRFTQGELISEAGLLIVGGSDTTVTAMSATIFYLLHNPVALARAQREVRNTFSSLEEITMGKSLDGCRYLVACIDESLRLSPPVGSILPRQVLAGGLRVEGEYLPEGTDVGVPHYALHHNPAYYRDPFAFQPERWIGSGEGGFTEIDVATAQTAFTAFGVGRTNCIGRHLAYQEILLVIGRLLFEYDMRLDSQSTLGEGGPGKGWGRHRKDEYQLMDRFVSMQDGPMVQFRVRSK